MPRTTDDESTEDQLIDAVPVPGVKVNPVAGAPLVKDTVGAGVPVACTMNTPPWLVAKTVLDGVRKTGGTPRVAVLLVTGVPLLITTRKLSPFMAAPMPEMVSEAVVAPVKVAPLLTPLVM